MGASNATFNMVAIRWGLALAVILATVILAGAVRQKRSRVDNYYLKKPIAPSDLYETAQFGMAGHAPYNQKMKYYDPGWQLRYKQWLASQAAFGFPFRVRGPTVNNKNKDEMKELLEKGMYHAYNSLRTKGNSLWKQYGYGLYGNSGLGKYKSLNHHIGKRSTGMYGGNYGGYGNYGSSWIHGYPGFYGLGLNALSRLASGGPFGAYPYGGGYGGYGVGRSGYKDTDENSGYGADEMESKQRSKRSIYGLGGYGGYGGYGYGGYGNFPWTGKMFYSKNFDYTAYNMANLMKKMLKPAHYG